MVSATRKRSWGAANVRAFGNGVVTVDDGALDTTAFGAATVPPWLELALATDEGAFTVCGASVALDVTIHAGIANVAAGVVARDVVRAAVFDASLRAATRNRRPLSPPAKRGLGWVEARGKVVRLAGRAGLGLLAARGEQQRNEDNGEKAAVESPIAHCSLSSGKTVHRKNRVAPRPQLSESASMGQAERDYGRVAEAIRYLVARVDDQPALGDLAAHLGLSPYHVQRMFRRLVGLSPKDFVQQLTLVHAQQLLADQASLLDASLAVGLSGPSRLHDLFVSLDAMTPGQFKRGGGGVEVAWGIHATPLGDALFAETKRGLCALRFVDEGRRVAVSDLQSRWPDASLIEAPDRTAHAAQIVTDRMRGRPTRPLSLALRGTPFQVQVWRALMLIPEGRVATYGQLAMTAGCSRAVRAVGTALGHNPISYLIPCHRVIRATGGIGEYRWGAPRKAALLALEKARSR
jgi:AraC family transcriptional regulator of adaptative response/methylated-DNA-[protein]-cysteine methyltransferase